MSNKDLSIDEITKRFHELSLDTFSETTEKALVTATAKDDKPKSKTTIYVIIALVIVAAVAFSWKNKDYIKSKVGAVTKRKKMPKLPKKKKYVK